MADNYAVDPRLNNSPTRRAIEVSAGVYADAEAPVMKWAPVTKADADLPDGVCRALWVGTAGTANLQQMDGTIRTSVPLLAGLNPFGAKQVRTGGTAVDIWALY